MVIAMGHQIVVSPDSPFTIDNIPFGVIKTAKESTPHCASAIGDYAIDLSLYAQAGNLDTVKESIDLRDVFSRVSLALPVLSGRVELCDTEFYSPSSPPQPNLNAFASLARATRTAVRSKIREDVIGQRVEQRCLVPLKEVEMLLPMAIGGYSDYYCSIEHVRNARTILSPHQVLLVYYPVAHTSCDC